MSISNRGGDAAEAKAATGAKGARRGPHSVPARTAVDNARKLAELVATFAAIGKSQAVIEFAMDGTILTANENFLATMGYSLEEIRGRHHRMFVDPAEADSAECREFWAKLGRGEHQEASTSGSARAAERCGSKPRTTRSWI